MSHPYKTQAKEGHANKLASYGGKSRDGRHFSDTEPYDGVPYLDSGKVNQPQRIPTRKTGGRIDGDHAVKRLDRAPRKKGGRVFEGSTKDKHEDKILAKKHHETMAEWERSEADKKHDRAERAAGGRVGKGKTVVNVVVSPPGGGQGPMPVPVPRPVPVPMSPPGMGVPPVAGPSMPALAGGAAPPPPPGMMRKRGGRVESGAFVHGPESGSSFGKGSGPENDGKEVRERFGGAGGLGRLEKTSRQEKSDRKRVSRGTR